MIMEAKGKNGQIILEENKIIIKRKGFSAFILHGFKGDKTILIKNITSVQYKKPGILTNGYIQLSIAGGNESKTGLLDATKDENTVIFTTQQENDFLKIKEYIENFEGNNNSNSNNNSIEQIKKLADLKEQGILTEAEFENKKAELLAKI